MTHEKPDKDPDLRQAQDLIDEQKLMFQTTLPWWKQIPGWYWLPFFALIAIGALLGKYLADGWDLNSWGAEHWGPLAAWFSGVLTLLAVGVALRQASTATKQARKAEKRADAEIAANDKRHKEEVAATGARHGIEIAAANERVHQQIESAQRTEQVKTLANLWSAIGDVHEHVGNVDNAFFRIEKDEGTVDQLNTAYALYVTALTRIDTAFTAAFFLVRNSDIEELIKKTEEAHKLLVKAIQKAYRDHENQNYHDQTHLLRSIAAVNAFRDPMIIAGRQYLDAVGVVKSRVTSPADPTTPPYPAVPLDEGSTVGSA